MKRMKLEAERNNESKVKSIQKTIKRANRQNESTMQIYDQAMCEVEVFQREIMTYMIKVG